MNTIHSFLQIERANFYLNSVVETYQRGEAVDGRLVSHLLKSPIEDGGQWDMVVNLILIHGLMPKSAFPESFSSESSLRMNAILKSKVRYEIRQDCPHEALLESFSGVNSLRMKSQVSTVQQSFHHTRTDLDLEKLLQIILSRLEEPVLLAPNSRKIRSREVSVGGRQNEMFFFFLNFPHKALVSFVEL